MSEIKRLLDEKDLDRVLAQPVSIIYKHSSRCNVATAARFEIDQFIKSYPGMTVHYVDVVVDRALSQEISARLNVKHESPQVIVLSHGRPVWHASHFGITAQAIAPQVAGISADG